MIIRSLFALYLRGISTSDICSNGNFTMNDLNLTPGIFFPGSGDRQQNTTNQSQTPGSSTTTTSNTPSTNNIPFTQSSNQPQQAFPQYQAPAQGQNGSTFPVMNGGTYMTPSQIMQTPNGSMPANSCDHSWEGDKFRECITQALKSLRGILRNCHKTLGENAPECRIDEECLESLANMSGNGSKKDDLDDRRGGGSRHRSGGNGESLDDFIEFLEKRMEGSGKRRGGSCDSEVDNFNDRGRRSRRSERGNGFNDNDSETEKGRRRRSNRDSCDSAARARCEGQCS